MGYKKAPDEVFQELSSRLTKLNVVVKHESADVQYIFFYGAQGTEYTVVANWISDRWAFCGPKDKNKVYNKAIYSEFAASQSSIDQVWTWLVLLLAKHGFNVAQSLYTPRVVYPEGEQQELCL